MEKLKQAVRLAGGIPVVIHCCSTPGNKIKREDVEGWMVNGLPDTELDWDGTNHAFVIATMQGRYSEHELLRESFNKGE